MSDPVEPVADSLVESFRKRKLVQWAVGYGAAAWVLLQALALVGQQFGWSPGLQRGFTVVLGVGFFVTLVLAWFHGERGSQKVSFGELAILMVLAALGGALFWRSAREPEAPAAPVAAAARTVPGANESAIPTIESDPSIAVLPLVNMSSDKEQDYFSDGISEELLNLLAKVPKLRVIARTSSFAYKGEKIDIGEVARKLHVAAVLEGSVRKSGDKVRITVQLIRANDSTHLWSETYDRTLDDIFKVQDEIASAVVGRLKISLLGALPTARPVDPKVYPLILQARALVNNRAAASTTQALALLQQALDLAPGEARTWDVLTELYITRTTMGTASNAEGFRLAREAASKALAIDPDDALAHSYLGRIAGGYDDDFALAAVHYQRALALNSTDSSVLINAARFATWLRRFDDARALLQYVTSHDPANPAGHYNLGLTSHQSGHWDEAIAAHRTALSLSPSYAAGHYGLGVALLMKGDAAAALAEMELEGDSWRPIGLPLAYYALGRKAEADAALARLLVGTPKEDAYNIAYNYAFRGDADRAFEWLDKAVEYHDPGLATLAVDPLFNNVYKDPRWLPFLRKLGRAPEQLAKIEFTATLPQ